MQDATISISEHCVTYKTAIARCRMACRKIKGQHFVRLNSWLLFDLPTAYLHAGGCTNRDLSCKYFCYLCCKAIAEFLTACAVLSTLHSTAAMNGIRRQELQTHVCVCSSWRQTVQ